MNSRSIIAITKLFMLLFIFPGSSVAFNNANDINSTNGYYETGSFNHGENFKDNSALASNSTTLSQPPRYGETPEDSVVCIRNLSLYREYYRQGSYDMAYEPWQEAMEFCPAASQNLYIHGARILKHRYNNVTDPTRRDMLIDSLMDLYDQRIEFFDREGFVLGRKGVDLYLFRPEKAQEVYEITERSIKLEGKQSQADVIVINFQTATTLQQASLKDEVEVFDIWERAMNIIEFNIEAETDNASIFERIKGQCESLFRPYYNCNTLVNVFTPRFEENPEDVELLEQITSMLDETDCTDEDLFYKASRNLHQIEPTASSAYLLARLESNDNNHQQALDYYEQAIELYKEKEGDFTEELYRTYMLKAELQYRQFQRYSQARRSALNAAELMPGDCRPYMMIGEMYATTAEDCGDDDFTERVAYWAAVDKFIQAKNMTEDESMVERADQLINAYSQYFPDRETIFFHGYEEGDSYRVECWINETTTVRAR